MLTKPTCPRCEQPQIEIWTMFTWVEMRCDACCWTATVPNSAALRKTWNRLIHRAAQRLYGIYGFSFSNANMTRWTTQENPQLGWDFLADMLTQAAVQRLGLPPIVTTEAWMAARSEVEAAEWAELRGWLWDAFSPTVTGVVVAAGRAA